MRRGLLGLVSLAAALGFPGLARMDDPDAPWSELPPLDEPEVDGHAASDAARLDAAREKRRRKGRARIAQARRSLDGAAARVKHIMQRSGPIFYLFALAFLLAALAACVGEPPRDECLRGEQLPCDGCSVGALRTNLRGVETCETSDAGVTTWGACRCSAGAP